MEKGNWAGETDIAIGPDKCGYESALFGLENGKSHRVPDIHEFCILQGLNDHSTCHVPKRCEKNDSFSQNLGSEF